MVAQERAERQVEWARERAFVLGTCGTVCANMYSLVVEAEDCGRGCLEARSLEEASFPRPGLEDVLVANMWICEEAIGVFALYTLQV